jgi:lysophospholipase L1-like esterase
MFKMFGIDTQALAISSLGMILALAGCQQDDEAPLEDAGAPSIPAQSVDSGSAYDAGSSSVADSGVAVVAKDAGVSVTPAVDSGSITIVTPIDPLPEAGPSSVDAGDASVETGDGGVLPPWATRADLGKGDGKDVVTIGDSWMSGPLGGAGIQAGLDRQMTAYRHYAVTATTLLSGQIPGQYDRAKGANPKISTVIMTAGGNDVMFSGGCNTKATCQAISDKISEGLDKLWTQMATDGVKDVLYIQYANVAGSTDPELRGMAKPVPICSTGKINCHSMETSSIVTKASDLTDGIHPNTAANTRIAQAAVALMEQRKMRR